jgi:hypothetical protein
VFACLGILGIGLQGGNPAEILDGLLDEAAVGILDRVLREGEAAAGPAPAGYVPVRLFDLVQDVLVADAAAGAGLA